MYEKTGTNNDWEKLKIGINSFEFDWNFHSRNGLPLGIILIQSRYSKQIFLLIDKKIKFACSRLSTVESD